MVLIVGIHLVHQIYNVLVFGEVLCFYLANLAGCKLSAYSKLHIHNL